jgi:thioredoxin-dependent peroxiredoxin
VIAVSGDEGANALKFRQSLKAPFPFVSDSDGALMRAFDVKYPLVTISKRVSFVIGAGRKVLAIQEGSDAIDPSAAVTSCSLEKPRGLQYLLKPKDGG